MHIFSRFQNTFPTNHTAFRIIYIKYHYNRVTHSSISRRNRIFYGNYCIKRTVLRTQYYRIESATDRSLQFTASQFRPHTREEHTK